MEVNRITKNCTEGFSGFGGDACLLSPFEDKVEEVTASLAADIETSVDAADGGLVSLLANIRSFEL